MTDDPRVHDAAIVADRWGMDIVAVLDEANAFRWAVRVAGHEVMCRLEKDAHSK